MIILVDLDGVVADWNSQYDKLLDSYGEEASAIPRTVEQHTFDLFSNRTVEERQIVQEVMNTPKFYAHLDPIVGAVSALNSMVDEGHTVYIVSSPYPSNPTCASDKYDWVKTYLGDEWLPRLILTIDKTAVYGDVLIDDKPNITGMIEPFWTQVVFDQLWNRKVATAYRMFGWEDWRVLTYKARFDSLSKLGSV